MVCGYSIVYFFTKISFTKPSTEYTIFFFIFYLCIKSRLCITQKEHINTHQKHPMQPAQQPEPVVNESANSDSRI